MCGICGIYNYSNGKTVDRNLLENMCAVLEHRGPDEQGIHLDRNLGMGSRRLSIIDLENGTQPIANEDNTVFVTLNGEIYNFQELANRLIGKGHRFRTRTDTEVIVHLYEEKGIDCLLDINGMFALTIWDTSRQEFYLARDRIGIKPLHYTIQNGALYYGSEIKAILQDHRIEKEIDPNALMDYLSWLYIPAPRTIYKGINKLLPGHYLQVKNGVVKNHQYWSFEYSPRNGKSEKELCDELEYKFDRVVARQMVSDVPLGAFLSGGVDSSMVVSSMAKNTNDRIKTFTIGFDHKGADERPYARRVAHLLGSDHHEQEVHPSAAQDLIKLLWYFDEPFADEAVLPTFYMSQSARQTVKVALAGDGADELFAGYRVYQTERLNRWYSLLPKQVRKSILATLQKVAALNWTTDIRDWLGWLEKGLRLTDIGAEERYLSKLIVFSPENQYLLLRNKHEYDHNSQLSELLSYPSHTDFFERLLSAGMRFNLPNRMLTKIDRASMAASLEVRVPFLDNEIIDLAMTLPFNFKLRGFRTKHIVKKVLAKRFPKELFRRPKHGFDVPFKDWFRGDLIKFARDFLRKERIDKQGIFNSHFVEKILKNHEMGISNNARQIYGLMVFQIWYNTFIEREVEVGG